MSNPYPWAKRLIHWTDDQTAYLSVAFTWHLPQAYQQAAAYAEQGYRVRAGGPAVALMPDYLAAVAQVGGNVPAVHRHNPQATFTSRGCPRRCPWCCTHLAEPEFYELTTWEPKPIVCDNNILATSRRHFDRVVDSLLPIANVDFISGFDIRLLTQHHARRITELDIRMVRLAWDDTRLEAKVHDAIQTLRHAGIPKKRLKVYVLIGYNDTPEDALYRLQTLKYKWGINPYPSRYQPPHALHYNDYVHADWTDYELRRMIKYWLHTRWYGAIPYEEFKYKIQEDDVTIPQGYRTVREAAAMTQTATNTLYQWLHKNLLPHVKHNGHYYVQVDAVAGCRQRDRISIRVPPPLPSDRLITVQQAHVISGVPVRTIQHYAKTAKITAVKHNGVWYVSLEDLTALASSVDTD